MIKATFDEKENQENGELPKEKRNTSCGGCLENLPMILMTMMSIRALLVQLTTSAIIVICNEWNASSLNRSHK